MKKKILIVILVILIIMFVSVIYIVANNKSNESNNNYTKISNERIEELISNSYKYYTLYKGYEKKYETFPSIELDNVKYYKISFLKSFEEIENLINSTFSKRRREEYYNNLMSERKIVETENKLYIEYSNACMIDEISISDVTTTIADKNILSIKFNDKIIHALYEDDDWYLDFPLHFCKEENKESSE